MVNVTGRVFRFGAVVLILLAAVGRGWGLWYRGLLEHDEGHALLHANTWWHVIRWILRGGLWSGDGASSIAALRDALHQQGGTLYSAGKLGYSLLLACVGQAGQVSTGLAMVLAWFGGILVAVLAGAVAFQYSRSVGAALVATLGCMTSPLLTDVSREASGTIWAVGFALGGLWMIQRGLEMGRMGRGAVMQVAGGGMLAYGFLCHFNLAPFNVAVFVAAGLFASRHYGGTILERGKVAMMALWPAAVGAIGGLAVAEIITRIADRVLARSYPDFLPMSGELRLLFFRDQVPMLDGVLYGDGAIGWGLEAWAVYGRALWNEGVVWLILLGVGMVSLARMRKGGVRGGAGEMQTVGAAAALLLVPALFWAAYVYRVERTLAMCMAASWIFIAVAGGAAVRMTAEDVWTRRRGLAAVGLVVLGVGQMGNGIFAWGNDVRMRSRIPLVVERTFAHEDAAGRLITAGSFDVSFAPLWKWAVVEDRRRRGGSLSAAEERGPRVDFSRFEGAEIVFVDPASWRRPNAEFQVTREQVEEGTVLVEVTNEWPRWELRSILLDGE